LTIFWGSKAPCDAIDAEDMAAKVATRDEVSPIPAWKGVKSYKSETKNGFTLPAKYIHLQTFDDSCVEYEMDESDEEFLEDLAERKFTTENGNPFIISPDLVHVTIDYLEKHAFRQERNGLPPYQVEGNDIRKKIEHLNGCILPKTVYLKICAYWKRKRALNGNKPLIESLVEEETRRIALEAEATKQRIKALENEYDELWVLRREMERIRMLVDTIKKREKVKTLLSAEFLRSVEEQIDDAQQTRSVLKTKRSLLDIAQHEPLTKKTKTTRTTQTTETTITKKTVTETTKITKKTHIIHPSPSKKRPLPSDSESEQEEPPTAKTETKSSPRKAKNVTSPKTVVKSTIQLQSTHKITTVRPPPRKKGKISRAEILELNKVNSVLKSPASKTKTRMRLTRVNSGK